MEVEQVGRGIAAARRLVKILDKEGATLAWEPAAVLPCCNGLGT